MTFDRDQAVQRIADHVDELTRPRTHIEPYYVWIKRNRAMQAHVTHHPPLLTQLHELATTPAVVEQSESGHSVPRSRPPGGFDALDRLMAIEAGSAKWVSVYLRRDLRDTVEDNLRLLVGAATRIDRDIDLRDLAGDVHRWHGWAATLTGWQTPPWRPRVACPWCERTGTLRVHLDKKRATCMACGEVWSEEDGTILLLADYIRELGEQPNQQAGASA